MNLALYPGLSEVLYRWEHFEACRRLVREGKACFVLGDHAARFDPGPGDERFPKAGG